jgi:hypothetical protein
MQISAPASAVPAAPRSTSPPPPPRCLKTTHDIPYLANALGIDEEQFGEAVHRLEGAGSGVPGNPDFMFNICGDKSTGKGDMWLGTPDNPIEHIGNIYDALGL